jgi:RNA polymerase sigma-70 factor, ECF subfamily
VSGGPSDAELIARVLALDDRHAFAELVRRHQSDVRALCRRLAADTGLGDDLAQETFLRAYRGLARYRGGARFSTWLYRIAYNLFLSEARKRVPRPGVAVEVIGHAPAEASDRRHDLEWALAELRPEERAALVLTYGRDVSHEEAATILDCPLGTLKTHVLRGKDKLRRLLADGQAGGAHGHANG